MFRRKVHDGMGLDKDWQEVSSGKLERETADRQKDVLRHRTFGDIK